MIYGIGTDIVDNRRIKDVFIRQGERFAQKILSTAEYEEWREKQSTEQDQSKQEVTEQEASLINYLAKRWAAKEAFSKACGTGIRGIVQFHHITITNDVLGKPLISLEPVLCEWLQTKCSAQTNIHLSLSDENSSVIAFVIIETV